MLQCSEIKAGGGLSLSRDRKIKIRDLIQLFMHLEQMQNAGISLLDSLSDIRDTTDNDTLRDVMSQIYRFVSEGGSLSEALGSHPKVFSNLYVSLVKAGEDTGDLSFSYRQLIKYLKWVDMFQSKVKKATRYPMVLLVVIAAVVLVMLGYVVPQIIGFIENLDQEVPVYTLALMATSSFFQNNWLTIIVAPVVLFVLYKILRKSSDRFAHKSDAAFLNLPVAGVLIRKMCIARYAQTFGALFSSGVDVLGCLKSARATVNNLAMLSAFEMVEEKVRTGSPLSEAFASSGEFPTMVIRMIKVGEESGNLKPVLDQVSEFYTKDVDEAVEAMVAMIEPLLTALLGGLILWIALAVFGPIYGSFENLDI